MSVRRRRRRLLFFPLGSEQKWHNVLRFDTPFIKLLRQELKSELSPLVLAAAVSGAANAGIITVINVGALSAAENPGDLRYAFMFLCLLAMNLYSKHYLMTRSGDALEGVAEQIRTRVAATLRNAELSQIERLGHSDIQLRLSRVTTELSWTCCPVRASL